MCGGGSERNAQRHVNMEKFVYVRTAWLTLGMTYCCE